MEHGEYLIYLWITTFAILVMAFLATAGGASATDQDNTTHTGTTIGIDDE